MVEALTTVALLLRRSPWATRNAVWCSLHPPWIGPALDVPMQRCDLAKGSNRRTRGRRKSCSRKHVAFATNDFRKHVVSRHGLAIALAGLETTLPFANRNTNRESVARCDTSPFEVTHRPQSRRTASGVVSGRNRRVIRIRPSCYQVEADVF